MKTKMKSPEARIKELSARIEQLTALRDRLAASPIMINIVPGTTLAEAQKHIVLTTYAWCGENKTLTADVLGMSKRTLYNWLAEWGVIPKAEAEAPALTDPAAQVSP